MAAERTWSEVGVVGRSSESVRARPGSETVITASYRTGIVTFAYVKIT